MLSLSSRLMGAATVALVVIHLGGCQAAEYYTVTWDWDTTNAKHLRYDVLIGDEQRVTASVDERPEYESPIEHDWTVSFHRVIAEIESLKSTATDQTPETSITLSASGHSVPGVRTGTIAGSRDEVARAIRNLPEIRKLLWQISAYSPKRYRFHLGERSYGDGSSVLIEETEPSQDE